MAQRKGQSKQRRRRRRDRRGGAPTVLVLLCLLIGAAAVITAMTLFFKIETFTVTGDSRYSADYIIEASGLQQGDNLVLFEKNRAVADVFEACPWLDTLRIRRRYPNGIEFLITECDPAAVLVDKPLEIPDPEDDTGEGTLLIGTTGSWLMDINGKLLEKIADYAWPTLPHIEGVTLKDPAVGTYVKFFEEDDQKPVFLLLNTAKDDGILQDIGEMDFTEHYKIEFTYQGRFRVVLGSTEELSLKLRYLHMVTEEKLGTNVRGTLDLSDVQTARFIPSTD